MIYADHAATTPCWPEVASAVAEALSTAHGNPESRQHPFGRAAAVARELARGRVADLIGAHADELIFTSGASEAVTLALHGCANRLWRERPRLLIGASEHAAVRSAAQQLASAGMELVVIPLLRSGAWNLARLADQLDARTAMVAAMAVNNETGVVNDVPAIAQLAHAHGALVLCDATQAPLRLPIAVKNLGADLAAFSAHKLHGPMGCGALWLRRGLGLDPLIPGGGQERGRRGGTPNLPGLIGFGVAAERLLRDQQLIHQHLRSLVTLLEERLGDLLRDVVIHGAETTRAPGITMVTCPGIAPNWLNRVGNIALSAGSACSSGSAHSGVTLTAMGVNVEDAANSLRISLGATSTVAEVEAIAAEVAAAARSSCASA